MINLIHPTLEGDVFPQYLYNLTEEHASIHDYFHIGLVLRNPNALFLLSESIVYNLIIRFFRVSQMNESPLLNIIK